MFSYILSRKLLAKPADAMAENLPERAPVKRLKNARISIMPP